MYPSATFCSLETAVWERMCYYSGTSVMARLAGLAGLTASLGMRMSATPHAASTKGTAWTCPRRGSGGPSSRAASPVDGSRLQARWLQIHCECASDGDTLLRGSTPESILHLLLNQKGTASRGVDVFTYVQTIKESSGVFHSANLEDIEVFVVAF